MSRARVEYMWPLSSGSARDIPLCFLAAPLATEGLEVLLERLLVDGLGQAAYEDLARAEDHVLLRDRALQVHVAAVDRDAGSEAGVDAVLVLERHKAESTGVTVALHHDGVDDLPELAEGL